MNNLKSTYGKEKKDLTKAQKMSPELAEREQQMRAKELFDAANAAACQNVFHQGLGGQR